MTNHQRLKSNNKKVCILRSVIESQLLQPLTSATRFCLRCGNLNRELNLSKHEDDKRFKEEGVHNKKQQEDKL
jgi:hypothetical protein